MNGEPESAQPFFNLGAPLPQLCWIICKQEKVIDKAQVG